jgi:hypothetical protein
MSTKREKKKDEKRENQEKELKIPDEFEKIIKDLLNDIKTTFPEYNPFIEKWWKDDSYFDNSENDEDKEQKMKESRQKSLEFIFGYCLKKYPPRFFDILYQNEEIFKEDSEIDTEFLPQIHFKNLWQCDISQKTRDTIWKYLQLIMFTIIGNVEDRESFGDTAKLFDCISEDEFKNKLQETMEHMQNVFDSSDLGNSEGEEGKRPGENFGINMENMPNAEDIHSHISGMMDGKLGRLAKEIAEETASELNLDMENTTDVKSVFSKLFKNPGKMMGLVKNIGNKLENKIKSGEIKESELIAEATEMVNKMKNMPGMDNIQEMLGKMGMAGAIPKGAKMNFGAMESQLKKTMKVAQMKERMKQKLDGKNEKAQNELNSMNHSNSNLEMSEEEIIKIFSTGEKVERTPRGTKPQQEQQKLDSTSSKIEKKKKKKK